MNPLMNHINQGSPYMQNIENIKQTMNMLCGSQDPSQMIGMLASRNPGLANVMNMVKGKDPKSVFFDECKRLGVDPNAIISMLK